jgi:uncharacterized protein YaaN involved in tellurite resistance
MENIVKDIQNIEADLYEIRARIAQYRTDLIRITNTRDLYDDAEQYIEELINSITDAYNDFDTVADDLQLAGYQCDNVVSDIEYQELSRKVQGAM